MRRRKLHRATFCTAAIYNVVWGLYSGLDPQWVFRFADLPPMQHPVVFATVGMVIGLYGVVYAEIARRPERGFMLALVGLVGKILGPIGLAFMIATGQWPPKAVFVILTNDLIWWIPFSLYLVDSWPFYRDDLLGGWPFSPDANEPK
jgi:hypothetical protein